jgi:hypothetical protein
MITTSHYFKSFSTILLKHNLVIFSERLIKIASFSIAITELYLLFFSSQNVFERLVDIICDKMSESLDSDPTLVAGGQKGTRLTDQPQGTPNSNCNC